MLNFKSNPTRSNYEEEKQSDISEKVHCATSAYGQTGSTKSSNGENFGDQMKRVNTQSNFNPDILANLIPFNAYSKSRLSVNVKRPDTKGSDQYRSSNDIH